MFIIILCNGETNWVLIKCIELAHRQIAYYGDRNRTFQGLQTTIHNVFHSITKSSDLILYSYFTQSILSCYWTTSLITANYILTVNYNMSRNDTGNNAGDDAWSPKYGYRQCMPPCVFDIKTALNPTIFYAKQSMCSTNCRVLNGNIDVQGRRLIFIHLYITLTLGT